MTLKERVDPELSTLRAAIRGIDDPRPRQEAERARFSLYAALEAADHDRARRWLDCLRVCMTTSSAGESGQYAASALDRIAGELERDRPAPDWRRP